MPNYDMEKAKPFTVLRRISESGRSRILIECPFCETETWAYIWSLSGGGKKCPKKKCGAIHHAISGTWPIASDSKAA